LRDFQAWIEWARPGTHMNNVGTVGMAMLTSFAWLVYYQPTSHKPSRHRTGQDVSKRNPRHLNRTTSPPRSSSQMRYCRPTFNPMHLIVPTSRSLNGLKILSTCTFSPVLSPGFKIDEPVKVSTWIASALYEASPTS
jgi:hypothetical protein